MSETTKKKVFLFVSECSLSYPKIVQMSETTKKMVFLFVSECSLSYPKIVQMSGITKQRMIFGLSSKKNRANSFAMCRKVLIFAAGS